MKPGALIILEGPENTGKTSLAEALAKALAKHGMPADYMSFPGRETASLGAIVYAIDHDPAKYGLSNLDPGARQALHLAAHLDAITNRIKPALAAGRWVILDRFWWSMWAHGIAQNLSKQTLRHLLAVEHEAWQPVQPAVVFSTLRSAPIREELTPEWLAVAKAYTELIQEQQGFLPIVQLAQQSSLEARLKSCLAWLSDRGLLSP